MAFGVVAVAGAPKRLVLAVGAIGGRRRGGDVTTRVLSAYQRDRLTAFARPLGGPAGHRLPDPAGADRDRLGRDGSGQGLFQGPQTQGGAIPFQQTDFVFSVAGEELGFLGAAGARRARRASSSLRTLLVRSRARDPFGRLVCVGVAGGSRCRRSRTSG